MTDQAGIASGDPWQDDVVTYRGSFLRGMPLWFKVGVVLLFLFCALTISEWLSRLLLLLYVGLLARGWWLVRATTMTVSSGGVERVNTRRRYAIRIPWADVEGLGRTRIRGMRWWTLRYAPQELIALEPSGQIPARHLAAANRIGVRDRFALDPFMSDPASSEFASRMTATRPDLSNGEHGVIGSPLGKGDGAAPGGDTSGVPAAEQSKRVGRGGWPTVAVLAGIGAVITVGIVITLSLSKGADPSDLALRLSQAGICHDVTKVPSNKVNIYECFDTSGLLVKVADGNSIVSYEMTDYLVDGNGWTAVVASRETADRVAALLNGQVSTPSPFPT